MAGRDGGKAVEPGIIARAVAGARYLLTGKPNDFFGPGQPMAPAAQEDAKGRRMDYPVAYNIGFRPRQEEAVDFNTLRILADNYDILRLAIETRKDQMGKLQWEIHKKADGTQDATAKAIQDFLQEPDKEQDFLGWQRSIIEEMLVTDAATIYVRPTVGGKQPYAFEQLDGSTIKRVLDQGGRTPVAPDPAYQQIIKGLPAVDYHRDELLYLPRNPRVHKVYGYSPVEQIIITVNLALRRQIFQLQYYTEGNVPDMLFGVPKDWGPDTIAEFQKLWDELKAGDTAARRRMTFVPGEGKATPVRAEPLFDQFDEWLARVVCYALSLPPSAFVKQMNRATATSAQEVALEEGLSPLMEWFTRLMNRLIRMGWGTTDYVFTWVNDLDVDPAVQMDIDVGYVNAGIRRVNEVRADHDWAADNELEQRKMNPIAPPGALGASGASGATGDPAAHDGGPQPGAGAKDDAGVAKLRKARARSRHY